MSQHVRDVHGGEIRVLRAARPKRPFYRRRVSTRSTSSASLRSAPSGGLPARSRWNSPQDCFPGARTPKGEGLASLESQRRKAKWNEEPSPIPFLVYSPLKTTVPSSLIPVHRAACNQNPLNEPARARCARRRNSGFACSPPKKTVL